MQPRYFAREDEKRPQPSVSTGTIDTYTCICRSEHGKLLTTRCGKQQLQINAAFEELTGLVGVRADPASRALFTQPLPHERGD
jgi:hypothetical protein